MEHLSISIAPPVHESVLKSDRGRTGRQQGRSFRQSSQVPVLEGYEPFVEELLLSEDRSRLWRVSWTTGLAQVALALSGLAPAGIALAAPSPS